VNFGDPVTLAGDANHVVIPDEVIIGKGGTVTFVVNGQAMESPARHAAASPRSVTLPPPNHRYLQFEVAGFR